MLLDATLEVYRMKGSTTEPVFVSADVAAARRFAFMPAAVAIGIIGLGVLVASVACFSTAVSRANGPKPEYTGVAPSG